MMDDCNNCRFARVAISDIPDEGPLLKCHRYPPTVLLDPDGIPAQSFPDAEDWCGEHQPVE